MFSLSTIFSQIACYLLTALITLEFSVFSITGGTGKELAKTPDNFTPVVRFAVCSDIHLSGEEVNEHDAHFINLFKASYDYAAKSEYKNLDAIVVAGDFTSSGKPSEYEKFNSIVKANIKDGTQLLCCLGNHEFIDYRDYDPTIGYTMYKQYINEEVDTHLVINGYHFIGVSYADDAKTFNGKGLWLRNEINKAVKDTGDKPVFVFQHPQPFDTVYGSVNWGTLEIRAALAGCSQVVDFSGHSHYASSDPRSIWQGDFTAVGTGSTAALMGNLNLIEGDEDAPGESGAFWIVEIDANGNIRMQLYDLVNNRFFEKNEYYLSDIAKQSAHQYTWGNLKSLDTAPVFPEDATITGAKNTDGTYSIYFPDATCYWNTENYKITISDGLKEIWSDTVISNYVRTVSDGMKVNVGEIPAGTYTVRVKPFSPYAKGGNTLTATITVD